MKYLILMMFVVGCSSSASPTADTSAGVDLEIEDAQDTVDSNNSVDSSDPMGMDQCQLDSECIATHQGSITFNDPNNLKCLSWSFEFDANGMTLLDTGVHQYFYCTECQEDADCPAGLICARKEFCSN